MCFFSLGNQAILSSEAFKDPKDTLLIMKAWKKISEELSVQGKAGRLGQILKTLASLYYFDQYTLAPMQKGFLISVAVTSLVLKYRDQQWVG